MADDLTAAVKQLETFARGLGDARIVPAIHAVCAALEQAQDEAESRQKDALATVEVLRQRTTQLEQAQQVLDQAQRENARLRQSAVGWEADALNYARSHGCQMEMTEKARALARTLAEKNEKLRVELGEIQLVLASQDLRLDEKHALARTLARALDDAEDWLRLSLSPCDKGCDCVLHGVQATLKLPAVQALLTTSDPDHLVNPPQENAHAEPETEGR